MYRNQLVSDPASAAEFAKQAQFIQRMTMSSRATQHSQLIALGKHALAWTAHFAWLCLEWSSTPCGDIHGQPGGPSSHVARLSECQQALRKLSARCQSLRLCSGDELPRDRILGFMLVIRIGWFLREAPRAVARVACDRLALDVAVPWAHSLCGIRLRYTAACQ